MNFLPVYLDEYACKHTETVDEVLDWLDRETHLKHKMPQMLAGQWQGRFLSMIAKMIRPKRILEIGTFTGYSAICFSEGLLEGGEIHTIDIDDELADLQNQAFAKKGIQNTVNQHVGDAKEIIPTLTGEFDLVFIDADKKNYPNYYNMVLDRIPSGGFILADNVLWSGKVPKGENDEESNGLRAFNELVQRDERVSNVLIPVRDGLMLIQKH